MAFHCSGPGLSGTLSGNGRFDDFYGEAVCEKAFGSLLVCSDVSWGLASRGAPAILS